MEDSQIPNQNQIFPQDQDNNLGKRWLWSNKHFLIITAFLALAAFSAFLYFSFYGQKLSTDNQINNKKTTQDQSTTAIAGWSPEVELARGITDPVISEGSLGDVFILGSTSNQHKENPRLIVLKSDREDDRKYEFSSTELPVWDEVTRFSNPKTAIDSEDNIHITWSSQSIRDGLTSPKAAVHYMKVAGDGRILVGPKRIDNRTTLGFGGSYMSDYGSNAEDPDIVVDLRGNAYIVWSFWDSSYKLHIAKIDQDGNQIEQATNTNTDGANPSIAIDSNNVAHIVWLHDAGETAPTGGDVVLNYHDTKYGQFNTGSTPKLTKATTLIRGDDQPNYGGIMPSVISSGDSVYVLSGENYFVLQQTSGELEKQGTVEDELPLLTTEAGTKIFLGDHGFVDKRNMIHVVSVVKNESGSYPYNQSLFYKKSVTDQLGEVNIKNLSLLEYGKQGQTDIETLKSAQNASDPSQCDEIENAFRREQECYAKFAMENKDVSLCEKITTENWRDGCIMNVAAETNNKALCAKIKNPDKYSDSCFSWIAKSNGNVALCAEPMTDSQRSNCYLELAKLNDTPSLCDNVTELIKKEQCYLHFAQTQSDSRYCVKLTTYYVDQCYADVALKTHNISLCEKIQETDYLKERCTRINTAIQECDSISDQFQKNSCYDGYGLTLKNGKVCESVDGDPPYELCY